MAESEKELKSLLMKVKGESEKAGLKLNIHKRKITASNPITSWQIDEETMETVTDFLFLGSKITAGNDCSHEIKRCLLIGRKVMTHLDSVLKSRDVTLSTKVHLVKAMVFPVVIYGCENWIIKKAESVSRSVMPDSLRPHGLQPSRLFCPWDFPGKDIGVGCHFLLQGIFPTQGLNLGLLHYRQILYRLSYKGSHKEG